MATHVLPKHRHVDRIFLRQGVTVRLNAREKTEVFTPLGSCVSCILFHPDAGAMITHARYPQQGQPSGAPSGELVEPSIYSAIDRFNQSGIHSKYWDVMLFGGGIINYTPDHATPYGLLGWQNVISALRALQARRLQISQANIAGVGGRRLFFWGDTGQAHCHRLENSFGGITITSKTPTWVLLESMQTRIQQLQSSPRAE